MKGLDPRYENVDLVIVRENTEDLYAGIEHHVGRDAAREHQDHHARGVGADRALRLRLRASRMAGATVTAVHKANIMKLSDGLFLESCRTVAAEYEGRHRVRRPHRRQHVHAAGPEARPVRRPRPPNLYGDIMSDLAAGLVGGLGIAPGANIGTEAAVFEPVHGSAPEYAGQNKANPTALILRAR